MLSPAEKERLLAAVLKRELEAAGYFVRKSADGSIAVLDSDQQPIFSGASVIEAGQIFSLWGGESVSERKAEQLEREAHKTGHWRKPQDHDPKTGLDTPETAAVREKLK